jgi:hypothetical protein
MRINNPNELRIALEEIMEYLNTECLSDQNYLLAIDIIRYLHVTRPREPKGEIAYVPHPRQ